MLSSCSVIAAAVVLVSYLVAYVVRHGVPVSISDTYYHIGKRWLFSAVLAAVGLFLLVPWVDAGDLQFCAFFACAAVLFVAASPQFRDSWVSRIHYGAAVVMGVCSVAWLIFNGHHLYALFLFLGVAAVNRKRWMWWVEIGIFVNVIAALLSGK